jgi:pyruvate/2-oxoglutarate dehydrogenase complex dihydrolipoamide acyltransferase (E2) component
MARHTIKVPPLGDATQISVVEWQVAVGGEATTDATLVILETDKVDTELPAPIAGTLVEILAPEGAEVAVGDPLCVIEA